MSVSKYNSILQATERDERTKAGGGGDDLAASESSMTSLGSYAGATLDTATTNSADTTTTTIIHPPRGDPESSLETNEAESATSLSHQDQALSFIQGGPEQSLTPSSFTLRTHALDISEQVEAAMEMTGPFICQLLIEHKSLLSKVLVGADGKSLLTDGMLWCELVDRKLATAIGSYDDIAVMKVCLLLAAVMGLARSKSVVEVTMLLCSQVGHFVACRYFSDIHVHTYYTFLW